MVKARKQYLESWYLLLDETCRGLVAMGYRIHGGSECFRILSSGTGNNEIYIKVYLNNYDNPTGIVVRYS